jgi:hypothetical protein
MPQTNITYDTPYNRSLVAFTKARQQKHFAVAGSAYAPTDMGFKLSNFHNDYSQEPKPSEMIGGGSPSPQKFMLNGNSPAYPPMSLSSGLAVSSGGSHYAGVDGAVGGYSFNDFMGDVAHVGKEVAPDLIRASMAGKGRRKKAMGGLGLSDILKFAPFLGLGRKGGSQIGDQIASVFKTIAPFAPLLMGLGHPAPKSKLDVAKALAHLGAKPSHSLPKMAELALRGGYDISDFGNDVAGVVSSLIGLGHPSKATKGGKKSKGGISLKDVLESAKPALKKVMDIAEANPEIVTAIKNKAVSVAKKAVGGGRSKRADIVKRIMKEKGLKMIEASSYVKQHGLYKP